MLPQIHFDRIWNKPVLAAVLVNARTLLIKFRKGGDMKSKRGWIAGLAVPVMIVVALLSAGSGAVKANTQHEQGPAKSAEITIDNFSFAPGTFTVAVGTTVTWINHDDIPHTVVSTDGVFKSKVMDTDEKFSYTFTKAGTYPYFCSVHPKMTGTIVVQ
jgi:plastocyanin